MATTKVSLFKRFINEMPEIAGSSFMALVGVAFMADGVRRYYSRGLDNRRYRDKYTVIRDDDPRAANVRKDYLADQ